MKLNNDIIELFTLFKKSNYQLFIIGGAVRDYLLKRKIEDYDFATDATPSEMIEILKGYKIDTYQALLGSIKVHLNKKVYEITTFRKELTYFQNRKPIEIEYVKDLYLDLTRRDFTINAIAYNHDNTVDIFGGKDDIDKRLIRCVGKPDKRFNEDALRIIRALRFSSVLGFDIEKETADSIIKNKKLLKTNKQKAPFQQQVLTGLSKSMYLIL